MVASDQPSRREPVRAFASALATTFFGKELAMRVVRLILSAVLFSLSITGPAPVQRGAQVESQSLQHELAVQGGHTCPPWSCGLVT